MTPLGTSFPGNENHTDGENGMGEWIEHDGKGMPVAGGVVVDVRFRDGHVVNALPANYWDSLYPEHANCSNWVTPIYGDPLDSRIVAYRVHPPKTK